MAAPVSNPSVVGLVSVAARFTTVPVTGPWAMVTGAVPVVVPVPVPAAAAGLGLLVGFAAAPPATALPSTTVQSSGSPTLAHGDGCGASSSTTSLPFLSVGFWQPLDKLGGEIAPGIL